MDGKTVRGSGDGKARPIHLVSAATDLGIVLGQRRWLGRVTNHGDPRIVDALLIKGYLVTIDAMGPDRDRRNDCRKSGLLLAVKGTSRRCDPPDRFAWTRDRVMPCVMPILLDAEIPGAWSSAGAANTGKWIRCAAHAMGTRSLRVVGGNWMERRLSSL